MSGRIYKVSLLAVLLLAGVLAVSRRFMLDDAFISLRYARNLVEGNGLVWNAGERVEGYTSPLWTLLLAAALAAGRDPIAFVYTLGPMLLLGTLACTATLALQWLDSRATALAATALLAINSSMLAFATGGLETQLLSLLVTALFVTATRRPPLRVGRALAVSLLTAACLLTRLDAAFAIAAAWLSLFWTSVKPAAEVGARPKPMAALIIPCALVLCAWFGWKLAFYRSFLPNTFYAKTGGPDTWAQGARFVWSFLGAYALWPSVLAVVVCWRRLLRAGDAHGLRAGALALVLSYLYIASVGGDFMEFRFCVPTFPLLCILIAATLIHAIRQHWLRVVLVASLLAGAADQALRSQSRDGIESVTQLASHLDQRAQNWIGVGQALRASLPEHSSVKIALTAAGAIPYYSRLPALDMLGLTDTWIARHGILLAHERGHTRLAPLRYLVTQGVHLVLGHPMLEEPSPAAARGYRIGILLERPYFPLMQLEAMPSSAALVEIPLASQVVLALLLRSHPDIERAIRTRGWRRFALLR